MSITFSSKEIQGYSFLRLINALANPANRNAQDAAKFELEVSAETARHYQKARRGELIPPEILRAKRDLTVGTATAGGNLVATDLLSQSFIDLLRNTMQVRALGATVLDGLRGNIAIPRQSGSATAYWVAENNPPTESQQTFDQVTLAPKTVAAYTDISRRLLLQTSSGVEALVRRDLAIVLALAIDLAAINGSGASNQPIGILNTTGIGSVAIGANGGAPTYAHIVSLWKAVAQNNANIGTLGWLTNAIMVAKLAQTEKTTGTAQFIIPNLPGENGMTTMLGMRCAMSNQVPANLTKGTSTDCSAIIFGNWADLIIGEWGPLDVLVNPYTGGTAGTVRVHMFQDCDIAIRHPESFAAIKDARDI